MAPMGAPFLKGVAMFFIAGGFKGSRDLFAGSIFLFLILKTWIVCCEESFYWFEGRTDFLEHNLRNSNTLLNPPAAKRKSAATPFKKGALRGVI